MPTVPILLDWSTERQARSYVAVRGGLRAGAERRGGAPGGDEPDSALGARFLSVLRHRVRRELCRRIRGRLRDARAEDGGFYRGPRSRARVRDHGIAWGRPVGAR